MGLSSLTAFNKSIIDVEVALLRSLGCAVADDLPHRKRKSETATIELQWENEKLKA